MRQSTCLIPYLFNSQVTHAVNSMYVHFTGLKTVDYGFTVIIGKSRGQTCSHFWIRVCTQENKPWYLANCLVVGSALSGICVMLYLQQHPHLNQYCSTVSSAPPQRHSELRLRPTLTQTLSFNCPLMLRRPDTEHMLSLEGHTSH